MLYIYKPFKAGDHAAFTANEPCLVASVVLDYLQLLQREFCPGLQNHLNVASRHWHLNDHDMQLQGHFYQNESRKDILRVVKFH